MRFLKNPAGDNMSLRGPAGLVELASNAASFGNRSQQTGSRFAHFQPSPVTKRRRLRLW
jgi:hypothetical protein